MICVLFINPLLGFQDVFFFRIVFTFILVKIFIGSGNVMQDRLQKCLRQFKTNWDEFVGHGSQIAL